MRDLLFTAAFAICLTLVTWYVPRVLNPFEAEQLNNFILEYQIETPNQLAQELNEAVLEGRVLEVVNLNNFLIILGLGTVTAGCYAFFFLLVVEKSFFTKPFQSVKYTRVLRRSLFFCLGGLSFMLYRFLALDEYLLVAAWGLIIVMELLITQAGLPKLQSVEEDNAENKLPSLPLAQEEDT